jgi:hypothetical protein
MTYEIRPAGDGGWLALAAGPRLLVVPELDDPAAAWAALKGEAGFQAALDLLTSRGLAATPSFVLVDWTEGADARLIVRGDATATVSTAGGDEPIAATGVSTWVERSVPGVQRLSISVPGVVPVGAAVLPLESGAAVIASVATGAPVASTAVAPAPVQPTVPLPSAPVDIEATVVVPDQATAPEPEPAEDEESYDYLFGDTMYRSVSDAAVRADEPDADGEPAGEAQAGDHDGQTVLTSDIAKLRGRKARAGATVPTDAAPPAPQLVLVLSTGGREPLTQPILVGRSPSVSKISGGRIPRLVTVGNGDQDISRNHAQFAVEGGTVVVTDLHSKNGTTIVLPGKDPQKLRAGEPTSVIPGTVVDLGGGITFTVDED